MAKESLEQGKSNGLGWFDAQVIPIDPTIDCRVPHVGWNNIVLTKEDDFFSKVDSDSNFYFDHSYKFITKDKNTILGLCEYEQNIVSIIRKGHIIGAQFHPEKSQRNGLKILRNYLNYVENY
jgi:glutamine amidotransferase